MPESIVESQKSGHQKEALLREYEPPEVVEIGSAEDLIEGNGTSGAEMVGYCCHYAGGGGGKDGGD